MAVTCQPLNDTRASRSFALLPCPRLSFYLYYSLVLLLVAVNRTSTSVDDRAVSSIVSHDRSFVAFSTVLRISMCLRGCGVTNNR